LQFCKVPALEISQLATPTGAKVPYRKRRESRPIRQPALQENRVCGISLHNPEQFPLPPNVRVVRRPSCKFLQVHEQIVDLDVERLVADTHAGGVSTSEALQIPDGFGVA
jgi:hypothetical protein